MQLISEDATLCARDIVSRIGRDLRVAVPIGIGKPVALLDALYEVASADKTISLTIFTGLTLTRPQPKSLLAARFVTPLLDRVLGTYAEPLYSRAQRAKALPKNIAVNEFFLQAGVATGNDRVQQAYTSLNYAHVARHLERMGVNVLVQAVAPGPEGAERVSLSSNTDVALDLLDYVARGRAAGRSIVVACEMQPELPFMGGAAAQPLSAFDVCLRLRQPKDLFSVPKEPVTLQDYAMALHAATLVKDGGMLQIGIGTFSDALTHALILRHRGNDAFRAMLSRLGAQPHPEAEMTPFSKGLYGCTELLVDGYLALMRAGILTREAIDADGRPSLIDAGFFLGNRDFYRDLRDLPEPVRDRISMRGISFTNTLRGEADIKRQARIDARFINSAMCVTLLGAVSSDATEDGAVVSGVGGQLDLVVQAHELDGARAIIAVRSHRASPFRQRSNIVWRYANCTVPRSLKDIVVTEYGIADLRGKSDRDTVLALISIADSAFQADLLSAAKRAGKVPKDVSATASTNALHNIERALTPFRQDGQLPLFPHGTEMTAEEQLLVEPLADLARLTPGLLWSMLTLCGSPPRAEEGPALRRLALDQPKGLKERLLKRLVLGAMRRRANPGPGT